MTATGQGTKRYSAGFTLVELIIVMVLVGIMAAVSTVFILQPFQASQDLERRAALVDAADVALNRVVREVRGALPNSVRLIDAGHVEFIETCASGRYRRWADPGGTGPAATAVFDPSASAGTFQILGGLQGIESAGSVSAICGAGGLLSVFNTGQPGFNAYNGENLADIQQIDNGLLSYQVGAGSGFAAHSPRQRFHVVTGPVSFVCEDGALWRYAGYALGDAVSGPRNKVAGNVADCEFSYATGSAARRGLLKVRLQLQQGGESVLLHAQAQVLNVP